MKLIRWVFILVAMLLPEPRPKPRYRCKCCGTNELDARAKGCPRGQPVCPMDFA